MLPLIYLAFILLLDCQTCLQIKNLQASINQLEDYVKNLTAKLKETELRLSQVEVCQCLRSCQVNGSLHPDGSTWKQNCDICTCLQGKVTCKPVDCPSVSCKNPYYPPNQCCPTCKRKCLKDGKYIEHGEIYVKDCVKCICEEGSLRCKRMNPLSCPPLNCPPEKQFKKDGECCKYCLDFDFCGQGHDCHPNATCHNLKTEFTCKCKSGYWGNGRQCEDIDECQQEGGHHGHLCRDNTKCVNLNGTYACDCLPGFKRRDSLNCIDIDECQSNEHKCDSNAKCINTHGGHLCECLPGFTGDGFQCQRKCLKDGRYLEHGEVYIKDCVKCLCENGRVCCTYSSNCISDTSSNGIFESLIESKAKSPVKLSSLDTSDSC